MMFSSPQAGHTVGEFGDKFRKAREKKEISLDDVSNVTKISARMLQAIEQEHFDQLPGGVFNKGFIRAYAKHLGLNGEEAVTDYLACLRQAQIDAQEIWEPERPRTAAPQKRRTPEAAPVAVKPQPPAPAEELPELQFPRAEHVRLEQKDFAEHSPLEIPWRIVAIAAVVIVLGIILWARRSHIANTASASAPNTVQARNSPAPASTPANPAPSGTAMGSALGSTIDRAAASMPPPASNSKPVSHPATVSPAAPTPTPAADSSPTEKNADKNDVTVRPPSKPTTKAPVSRPPSLTLVIRATETSWISVFADGQPVSHETLIAPAHTSIRADHEIVAKVGNAAGVTFLWNGKEIPAEGAESEVKTFVFDANGMHVAPSP
jgi:cytoskeletal protein RodZ